jgi:hypothetical protein
LKRPVVTGQLLLACGVAISVIDATSPTLSFSRRPRSVFRQRG